MQTQKPSTETYTLAHASYAHQGLLKQGQMLNPFTRQMFEAAGITAGMKVLDVGCALAMSV